MDPDFEGLLQNGVVAYMGEPEPPGQVYLGVLWIRTSGEIVPEQPRPEVHAYVAQALASRDAPPAHRAVLADAITAELYRDEGDMGTARWVGSEWSGGTGRTFSDWRRVIDGTPYLARLEWRVNYGTPYWRCKYVIEDGNMDRVRLASLDEFRDRYHALSNDERFPCIGL